MNIRLFRYVLGSLALIACLVTSSYAQFIPGQVLTASQLNSAFSNLLPLSGGTLNGPLSVPSLTVSGSAISIASGGTGANTAVGALASIGAAPAHVSTLTALQASSTANAKSLFRDGYTVSGDGGNVLYVASNSACSLNSGAGDGGLQVQGANGKCWLAQIPTAGADVRIWGAVADGSTDAGPAINACLQVQTICVIPATTNGLYVATPIAIPAGSWLVGTVSNGENTYPSLAYPGTSWLKCAASISGACVTWGTQGTLLSGGVKDLVITRVSGTPTSGQIGLVFAGGYNVRMEGVSIVNFDSCAVFQRGISGQGINNYLQACATHYWVFDTWPEFSQTGGRSGMNGSGNPGTALDNVYFTSTIPPGGGGTGPNSIDFVNYKFENDNTACAFRWGHYVYTPGAEIAYNFVNIYKEPMPSGASLFCSDSTVSTISGVRMQNSYVSQDSGPADMFSGLNAATQLANWTFTNNYFALNGGTMAPTSTGGPGINNVTFIGNFLPNMTFTPGGTLRTDKLTLVGNLENNTLTINQGSYGWQQLSVVGDQQNSIVNNSDGYNQTITVPRTGVSNGLRVTSTLPTCNASTKGFQMTVTDATSPTYGGTLTGGGSVVTPVFCNGSAWVTH
ncbi:hypothetical protein [Burkholderia cenocepacia]|uniref:hypothetical protein n=1 Tax=Burkholderia cenocepacia TaxID=95486 RepID=UPI000F55EEBB|nr:hypothetical protein [Burkholderia cenocepacia]RQV01113.1 hypothetical protein DF042_17260 [Burkholderia cenocepacia]